MRASLDPPRVYALLRTAAHAAHIAPADAAALFGWAGWLSGQASAHSMVASFEYLSIIQRDPHYLYGSFLDSLKTYRL